ncbi:MAG TPA: 4-(cytidine 5'-diphospho)-2-C-methyl-D-erythritol kinase, partial [Steroidobacteraceae bacterium]|nr:4-(cytidine 5'-diphospho)-2-C-methyl-D-erythritol kinase [Steroidobacteraceae bacterium]
MTASAVKSPAASRGWWPAPAKLNLFLHVTGRRNDGYHNLQTVFQLLDWGDELGIEVTTDGRVERLDGPEDIAPAEDLCVRAALALQSACAVHQGAQIRLRKRVPIGAGLGGGSSDAATVLRVLNLLWGTGLSLVQLADLGLQLGSDVPIFVHGSSAWAEGRGEKLTPIELPPAWYLIVWPGVAVSTAEIFQAPELTRNSPLITIRALSPERTRN